MGQEAHETPPEKEKEDEEVMTMGGMEIFDTFLLSLIPGFSQC